MKVMINADLHAHGPVGFDDFWLKRQGYDKGSLIQKIADACFRKKIDVCALVSEDFGREDGVIERYSPADRLGYLKKEGMRGLPSNYDVSSTKNVIYVNNGEESVILFNAQTVVVNEDGIRYDHLVIGSNEVPNNRGWRDTINYAHDYGLIQGFEHLSATKHFGIGLNRACELFNKFEGKIDFIEGHNSMLAVPFPFSLIPPLKHYRRKLNTIAQEFANTMDFPWIATSDAHRIEDIGKSYITLFLDSFDRLNEDCLISRIRDGIRENKFTKFLEYPNFSRWIMDSVKMKRGFSHPDNPSN